MILLLSNLTKIIDYKITNYKGKRWFIDDIFADEVLDSRGNPTVRATVTLSDGTKSLSRQ